MQLIVGDKRVNVTMRAKDAMIVIIALKGEELHKAGLTRSLHRDPLSKCWCSVLVRRERVLSRWSHARARCSLDEHEHRAGRAVERAASYGACC